MGDSLSYLIVSWVLLSNVAVDQTAIIINYSISRRIGNGMIDIQMVRYSRIRYISEEDKRLKSRSFSFRIYLLVLANTYEPFRS